MTCYMRSMDGNFATLGLDKSDKAERKRVHAAVVSLLGLAPDVNCSEIWATIKERYGVEAKTVGACGDFTADIAGELAKG
jgi:hypothetical protein